MGWVAAVHGQAVGVAWAWREDMSDTTPGAALGGGAAPGQPPVLERRAQLGTVRATEELRGPESGLGRAEGHKHRESVGRQVWGRHRRHSLAVVNPLIRLRLIFARE
jgi:hypothetical protein